jgi:hypothetical protein
MRSAIQARRLVLGMSLVAVTGASRAAEPATAAAVHTADRAPPRSHLQPVGEMVRAASPVAIGLRLARAPQVLREQLGLQRGAGLVVEAVQPESAAERAGFLVNDVVVRLDDQLMLLPEQFIAFAEASRGEPALACHVLRAGAPVVIPLDQRAGVADTGKAAPDGLRAPASTLALLPAAAAANAPPPPAEPLQLAVADVPEAVVTETLVRKDADYSIRLTAGDETRLLITDHQGRLVFNDCIDTPEARSRLPQAVRERVERMERHLERRDETRRIPVAEIGRLDVAPIRLR